MLYEIRYRVPTAASNSRWDRKCFWRRMEKVRPFPKSWRQLDMVTKRSQNCVENVESGLATNGRARKVTSCQLLPSPTSCCQLPSTSTHPGLPTPISSPTTCCHVLPLSLPSICDFHPLSPQLAAITCHSLSLLSTVTTTRCHCHLPWPTP